MIARTFFWRTSPPYNRARPGPVIISTSAALTSIQALSAEDCAAATLWSSWPSLSATALGTSGEAAAVVSEVGVCCACKGRELRTRVNKQQHKMPMRFINKVLQSERYAPTRYGIQHGMFRW